MFEAGHVVIVFTSVPHRKKIIVNVTFPNCRFYDAVASNDSYGKPDKVDSSSTFSRWFKTVLSLAGIDNCIFKGHSFRGASTSKAVSLGVPLDVVLKTTDWKNAGTFAKFYQRATSPRGSFAQVVLAQ